MYYEREVRKHRRTVEPRLAEGLSASATLGRMSVASTRLPFGVCPVPRVGVAGVARTQVVYVHSSRRAAAQSNSSGFESG